MNDSKRHTKNDPASDGWIRRRHYFVRTFLGPFVRLWLAFSLPGLKMVPLSKKEDRPCLILYNHQTAYDQFFVSFMTRRPVYHVATEDLLSNGFISRVLTFLVAPIPIKKQVSDIGAVKNCVRIAKEGGTIAIAPEGNRTFDGRTVYINPAIAKLVKLIKLPVVFLRLEGGYGVLPRWADKPRRGKMKVSPSRILEPEEYQSLDAEALYELICNELYRDESLPDDETYRYKGNAEYMERMFYVCPKCGFSRFESKRKTIRCTGCGLSAEYDEHKKLLWNGVAERLPSSVREWYDLQNGFVNSIDPSSYTETPVFTDRGSVFRVILRERKEILLKDAPIRLFGDRIEILDGKGAAFRILPFSEISVITVLGRNKLNIYGEDGIFQFKSEKRFNALKYMNLFYRYKNMSGGQSGDKFLGL